jgi:hypothetical protein
MAFFAQLRKNPSEKKIIISEIFTNLIMAFLTLRSLGQPSQGHLFPVAAAIVI